MAASSARVTRLRHQSIMGRLHVSHKSQILLWASPVSPQPGPASSWPSHKITLEGYPRIHTSDFLMSSRNRDYVYLWALHYHEEGATRSLVSTLFVFILLLSSTQLFTTLHSWFWDWNNPFDDYSSNENIKNSSATLQTSLSQMSWEVWKSENWKLLNQMRRERERVPYFWCGENFILQPSKSNFLTAFGDELNSHTQYKEENYTFKDSI